MKTLKKNKPSKYIAIVVLGLILSLNVNDAFGGDKIRDFQQHRQHRHHGNHGNHDNSVGAPLDGGIFSIILAGAGIAYFNRKRKKNKEQ